MRIVVRAKGGLGQRMKVIASCIALCQRLRHDIDILWVQDSSLNCPFSSLFEPIDGLNVLEKKYLSKWNTLGLRSRKRKIRTIYKGFDIQFSDSEIVELKKIKTDLVKLIRNVDSVFIETNQHFYGDESYLSYLKPQTDLATVVGRQLDKYGGKPFVGLQVSRGDGLPSRETNSSVSFIARIELEIKNNPEVFFYLSSNDLIEVSLLKSLFSSRILCSPDENLDNEPRGVCLLLIDLLVLAKATHVISNCKNTFSEVVRAYGGVSVEYIEAKRNG